MKRSTLAKVCIALISLCGVTIVSACASSEIFRTYYLDGNCNYYYVDGMGHTVVDGKYVDARYIGLPLRRGADGRMFYQDSFGNRVYVSARCANHCGRVWKD